MRSNWSRAVGQALFKSFRQSTQIPCASSVVLSSAWHLGQRMAACCMLAWVHLFLSCGPFPSFMRKHMFRQPGQYFRRSRSNDFSWRRWIFWRGAGCLHHYFLQVGDVATDHWASLEAYQTNQKLMKSCWDASQKLHAFCFVSVEVQMSQTLSNRCFWNLFSNFRTLMKVFTNSVVNFVVARIPLQMRWSKVCVSFTHSKLAWFFSSTPNTPLSRIVHVTGKNLSIGGAHVSKIAIVLAGSQLHFTRAGHTLLARMSNAISLSVLWASAELNQLWRVKWAALWFAFLYLCLNVDICLATFLILFWLFKLLVI